MAKGLRWALVVLVLLLALGLGWFELSSQAKVSGLRNIVHYRVAESLGGRVFRSGVPPGAVDGRVHDAEGRPVAGATVLIASPLGHVYTSVSDAAGQFRLTGVPPGRYVPVAGKRGYADALPQICLAGLCYKKALAVRPDRVSTGLDLELVPSDPLQVSIDASLRLSPTEEVEVTAPLPGRARRTHFSFERAGIEVNDCWLYEPVEGQGPFPALLLILPGPVLGWEIIPVPFAAQGFSVLACYPLRGIDIEQDAADLLTAWEYLRREKLPSHADTGRLGLVGASFTSLHAYRLLGLTEQVDVALILGGMADGFAFRHDVEAGTAYAREPFDQALIALGFPNSSPELYFKYSAMYHLEGLPPLCLLHGVDDELVPFNQSVMLAEELERRGMPYEFYSYEGLKHYFSTSGDDATTQQMFRDSLDCLRRSLLSE